VSLSAPNVGSAEWRKHWYLPFIAGLGYSAIGLQSYALGPFIAPLQQEFGWSRAAIFFGTTIANLGAGLLGTFIGWLIDRLGPRGIGLAGVILMPASVGLLSLANGRIENWATLWMGIALGMAFISPTIWTSAVFSRFKAGRGMALAITLSGSSLGAVIFPPLSTWLINAYGWRSAFVDLAVIWALILFPLVYLFFRGAQDGTGKPGPETIATEAIEEGVHLRDGLRMPAFYQLMLAGACVTFTIVGIVIHLVPILTDNGAAPMTAAFIASFLGVFSIIGRLGNGVLLDRYPAHIVGAATLALPIFGCLLLLSHSFGTSGLFAAAAFFGLTLGAEINIVTYLAMLHFGLRHFGVLTGTLMTAIAVGSAIGPLAAGFVFDKYQSYVPYLWSTILLMLVGVTALATLRRVPVHATSMRNVAVTTDAQELRP
jgi:MFS family permease